jgi:hypothetical protein
VQKADLLGPTVQRALVLLSFGDARGVAPADQQMSTRQTGPAYLYSWFWNVFEQSDSQEELGSTGPEVRTETGERSPAALSMLVQLGFLDRIGTAIAPGMSLAPVDLR